MYPSMSPKGVEHLYEPVTARWSTRPSASTLLLPPGVRPRRESQDVLEARAFLTTNSERLRIWCQWLSMSPSTVIDAARKQLAETEAWERERGVANTFRIHPVYAE